jgi:hypothetical protein
VVVVATVDDDAIGIEVEVVAGMLLVVDPTVPPEQAATSPTTINTARSRLT